MLNAAQGSDRTPHALSKAALQKAHAPGHTLPTPADAAAATKQAVPGVSARASPNTDVFILCMQGSEQHTPGRRVRKGWGNRALAAVAC